MFVVIYQDIEIWSTIIGGKPFNIKCLESTFDTKAGHNSNEIHIVFDNYREDSIKNGKRDRRTKSKEIVALDVISPN